MKSTPTVNCVGPDGPEKQVDTRNGGKLLFRAMFSSSPPALNGLTGQPCAKRTSM